MDLVIHGGDVFHTPDVSNKFTGELAKIIKSWGVDTYVTPGNHDVYGYNLDTLNNTKLGLLSNTGVIKILDRANPLVFERNGKKIAIEGQEYHKDIDKNVAEDFKITKMDADYNILVYHGMLLDHEFFDGVHHTRLEAVNTMADLILAGHYHPGLTQTTINGVTFCNPGSVLRIENTAKNRKAEPKIALINIDDTSLELNIEYIKLQSALPGDQVFKAGKSEQKASYENSLSDFHSKLQQRKFFGVDLIAMVNDYADSNPDDKMICESVKESINRYAVDDVDNGYIPSSTNVYITKVVITNFQAHGKRVVDFVNGLNVIKGESNAGKTAILRAIFWCLYDKPNGSDFIKTGAKSCKVELYLSNGYCITRKRSRSSSGSYILMYPDGTEQEFKGFSNSIPVDITNAHQMPEIKIAGNGYRINVAAQLDAPFLVGYSPNERVNMIGSLVEADKADEAKKEFTSEKRRLSAQKKSLESSIESKEQELAQYANIDNAAKTIKIIEAAIGKLESDEAVIANYTNIRVEYMNLSSELKVVNNELNNIAIPSMEMIDDYRNIIDDLSEFISISNQYNTALNDNKSVNEDLDTIPCTDELNKLIKEYESCINLIAEYSRLQEEYLNLSKSTFEFDYDLDALNKYIEDYKAVMKEYVALNTLVDELASIPDTKMIDIEIQSIDKNIETILRQKENKIKELEGEDIVCPYCKQKVDIALAVS